MSADVVVVSMPWEDLTHPSVQLGTLKALLDREGFAVETRTYKIDFVEHCLANSRSDRPFRVADYQRLSEYSRSGLAEWLFVVPPYLEGSAVEDEVMAACHPSLRDLARHLRELVPSFLARCLDDLLASGARVVGFSSTFAQNVPSLVLAKMLKFRAPSVRIVFGGSNCEGPMGAALLGACPWIDVVVRGEAERVLAPLVRDLLDGAAPRAAPGLCYRTEHGPVVNDFSGGAPVSMSEVPAPDFAEFFERIRRSRFYPTVAAHLRIAYESARGCWWGERSHCTFCGLNGRTMKFRSKPAERVLEELSSLSAESGVLDFVMTDNILDLGYLEALLPRLADQEHQFRLFYEVKSNLRREHVRRLREAGVVCIQPGIESLSTPILKLMGKGVTAFQNIRLLKWCAEYGIRPGWNIIYGFPGEPEEEYARMADTLRSLTHLEPPDLTRLSVHRFSPYHQRPRDFGIEIVGPKSFYATLYDTDPETLSDIAYTFEHRYLDGRDPEGYVVPVRESLAVWRAPRERRQSLRYRRGPGFIEVLDRRPGLRPARYVFRGVQARIFDACEDGATPAAVARTLGPDGPDAGSVQTFLDELLVSRLVYEERGRYLALALPMDYEPPPIVTEPRQSVGVAACSA